jgi:3-hydroxyacyl-CoA dehydrogenase/enoyl-CoA hydratase/3-hydroxybutyryl-CoA epimerase
MEATSFRYAVSDGVAVFTLDVPDERVNTLSPQVALEFMPLLQRALQDSAVRAMVFISGKPDNFLAGANLDFLSSLKTAEGAEAASRQMQEQLNKIAEADKPMVAAIHGSCLGGGYEWALACHYRIASDSPKTSLGLPETQLGLLPGGGGTQRLPRLIGAPAALDIILAGKAVKAPKAKKLGMVDEVVPQAILEQVAKRRALELAAGKLPVERRHGQKFGARPKGLSEMLQGLAKKETWQELALEDNPLGRRILFEKALGRLLKKTRGKYPAPEKALLAIRTGLERGMEEGLVAEAKLFGELVASKVSRRLIELFFATTALKKENGTSDPRAKPRPVKKVAVVGGGLMGGGIAYVTAAQMGVPVRVRDKDDAGVGRALKQVQGILDERVKRRSMSAREAAAKMALVSAGTDYAGFKSADLVIEAVFEDVKLKHEVIRQIESKVKPECIFASNTSSLPLTVLAQASSRPETVIGMHYFSPVNKMPLLEIVRHPRTADWVVATCVDVGKKQGKTVIVVNDGVGFYTTRALAPYMNESVYLLAEGADIEQLDAALVEFGFPVGPITLLDEVGIDVGAKVSHVMNEAFGERMASPEGMDKILADGRLGRKNKKGFYTYGGEGKQVDETVYALLPHGRERKQLDGQEMAERCVYQFINEAIRCLEEEVLRSPRDGDVGAVYGLGFPPFLGGPFRYVDEMGAAAFLARLSHWHSKLGKRFEPSPLLVKMANEGKRFFE